MKVIIHDRLVRYRVEHILNLALKRETTQEITTGSVGLVEKRDILVISGDVRVCVVHVLILGEAGIRIYRIGRLRRLRRADAPREPDKRLVPFKSDIAEVEKVPFNPSVTAEIRHPARRAGKRLQYEFFGHRFLIFCIRAIYLHLIQHAEPRKEQRRGRTCRNSKTVCTSTYHTRQAGFPCSFRYSTACKRM